MQILSTVADKYQHHQFRLFYANLLPTPCWFYIPANLGRNLVFIQYLKSLRTCVQISYHFTCHIISKILKFPFEKCYSMTRTFRYIKLIVVALCYNSRIILLKNAPMMIELNTFSLQEWHSTIELYRQNILYHIN